MRASPILFLMVGLPGAGKTTAACHVRKLTGAEHIWADGRRLEYFGQPCFTHDENTLLYAQLNEEAAMLLADGANVIYDTSFNYYKDRQMMREIAARHGAKTLLIHVKTPEAVACRRATDGTNNQPTRVLGPMEAAHFARLSRSLEVPLPHEDTIKLDGEQITAEYIRAALWEADIVTLGD